MIEMYKILSGKYDTALIPQVNREYSSITRGLQRVSGYRKVQLSTMCVGAILLTVCAVRATGNSRFENTKFPPPKKKFPKIPVR